MSLLAQVETASFGDVIVAAVTGELDRSNVLEVRERLLELVPGDASGVVIDFSKLRYIDSAGMDMLFDLQRRLVMRRAALALCLPKGAVVNRALTLAGVTVLIPFGNDLPAAVESLSGADD